MEWIYGWIRGLAFYLILMTMLLNLLPNKTYEKYIRLFTGMIFILLVFRPFADLTGIEEKMAGAFERITFQNDAKLLRRELEDAEQGRLDRLLLSYESAVEQDLITMAGSFQVECLEAQAVLERDCESGEFGALRSVFLSVKVLENAGSQEERRRLRLQANREIGQLKKKIGEYYGLEEGDIEIQLENE